MPSADPAAVRRMADALGISNLMAELLVRRGIEGFEEARRFFRTHLSPLHDPFLMKDMEQAVHRVRKALRDDEKIQVYGDYDVDGTTAVAMLTTFLRSRGAQVATYIPHRFKEGYGIQAEGVEHARQLGVSLIISVDCGISAVQEAKMIRAEGMDLIICDHHTVGEILPDAVAVLDPKRPDCPYPFKGLSGAGVTLKLIQAILQDERHQEARDEPSNPAVSLDMEAIPDGLLPYLDLAAVSIASDIVPMVDENRKLMAAGLERLNTHPRPGFEAMMKRMRTSPGSLTSTGIVFSFGPRINAAGRMGDAGKALEVLMASDIKEASAIVEQLEEINEERKRVDQRTMERAVEIVAPAEGTVHQHSIILHDPEWHLGVIGIVASRLVDRYMRPVVMLANGKDDGIFKGSARSVKGFNIYEAFRRCDDLLVQFGGHEFAAGLTLEAERFEAFSQRMREIAAEAAGERGFARELCHEGELHLEQIDARFWKLLSQFEPFGPGNDRPVFISRGVRLAAPPALFGKGHLRLRVSQAGSHEFEAVGFNMAAQWPRPAVLASAPLDIAYQLEENRYQGKRRLQMTLLDLRMASN